jgi:hypothetical protein
MNGTDRKRRWMRIVAVIVTALLIGAFIGSRIVGSMFRTRLAATLRDKLGADLVGGSVLYLPPYTFVVRDLRVIGPDRGGKPGVTLTARALLVKLVGFPKKGAPPSIDRITLDGVGLEAIAGRPEVHLRRVELRERQTGPEQFKYDLDLDGGDGLTGQASANLDSAARLIQINNLSINGRLGNIAAQIPWSNRASAIVTQAKMDGSIALAGSGSIPLSDPGTAIFQLSVVVDDVSAWVAPWNRSVDHGRGRVLVRSDEKSPVGAKYPSFEASLDHFELNANSARLRLAGGKFDVEPSAQKWRLAEVVGSVQMGNSQPLEVEPPEWFSDRTEFGGPVEFTAAASGPFRIPAGQSALDAIRHEVLAYPHDCWLRPRKFPMAITHLTGGPIAFRGGVVALQNLGGIYGKDKLLLRTARLTLEDPARQIRLDDLRTQFKYEEIAGTMIFARPNATYPGVFGKTVAQLRPEGAFEVGAGSWYATNRPRKDEPWRKLAPDLFLHVSTDGGSFLVTPYQIPLNDIHGDSTISPLATEISHFEAKTLGGTAAAVGRFACGRPFFFNGQVQLRDIDLKQFGAAFDLKGPVRSRLSGIAYANIALGGESAGGARTPLEALTAAGEFQILRGDFWAVPPLHEVATGVRKTDELGVGDAAGVFHIANQMITLDSAAINSPLMGLQGSGTIGFDKSIDLAIVAAPFGDWRDKMAEAGIPIVGDILGAVQQLLNTAQGALLYQFRVTGTASNPVKSVVPAPIITNSLALLFGQMLQRDSNGQLLNEVRASTSQPSLAAGPLPASQPATAPHTQPAPPVQARPKSR